MKLKSLTLVIARLASGATLASFTGCSKAEAKASGIAPKHMADALHAVMESDRIIYTKMVVNRLQNEEKVIKASEHWKDDKALPLPAQMFRMGAEMVQAKNVGGNIKVDATTRGMIRWEAGDRPSDSMASICSVTRMVPSSAA
jgi:hypothetical protein